MPGTAWFQMKRLLIKIIVLALVFAGSVYAFSYYFNREETRSVKTEAGASLPVLMIQYEGTGINSMFGYSEEMDERSLRDSITLLSYDRNLTLAVMPMDAQITGVAYQVSSFFDGSVTENGKIKSFSEDGAVRTAQLHLENPVTMGQEYMLRFDVTLLDGRTFYYYTRILQRNGQNLTWYLEYTDAFYRNCLQKTITDDMRSQLEPETSESNSSLHYVNIHSDEDQLTWGGLEPLLVKQAVPTVLEVNETTVSIGLDYMISARDESGNTEYYSVSEYYRMRKAQDYVVLLDFERTTEQCFDSMLPVLTENGINLGITGKDVSYRINSDADIAVFVQAGELWSYNRTAGKASRIFTFREEPHTDARTENQEYGLKISDITDDGIVTYIVYGHMNSGAHEGGNGLMVCRYYPDDNKSEELLYVPSNQGHEILGRGVSRLAYLNENNQFFACIGDSISSIQLSDLSSFFIQESLDWNTFAVSDSQTSVAWTNEKDGKRVSVSELDLNTGDTLEIEAPNGEQIVSLCFMGEDLVYGLYREIDAYTDETGNTVYPMYRICLMNSSGEPVKDFYKKGLFISSVTREESMLTLSCLSVSADGVEPAEDEQIVYYETEREENVSVRLTVEERKGTEVCLAFTVNGRTNSILTLHARTTGNENVPSVELLRRENTKERYFVYAAGGLYGIYDRLNTAIETADDQVGVVLNYTQQYVWERGNYKESAMIDTESLPKALLKAPIDEEKLQNAVGEGYQIWNLSGCSLSSIRYQIDNGYPVCAKWSGSETVLIIGYDNYENIWIYDRETKEPRAIAEEEAQEAFGSNGNIFISYHI